MGRGKGTARFVWRLTEMLGAVLTRVRVPGAMFFFVLFFKPLFKSQNEL